MITTDLLFTCYPDKRIPESDEGQNLQLLLPPASRSMCGYIDEKLLLFTAFWAVIVTGFAIKKSPSLRKDRMFRRRFAA